MIYTTKENESFDPEILRQELVVAIGPNGWSLQTGGNTVTFNYAWGELPEGYPALIESTILAHFANGATREANKAILKQIAELEATQTPRRIREGGQWMVDLDAQIAALRKNLK